MDGAALAVQVKEAEGDLGALEGEGQLVRNEGLSHAAFLIADQDIFHVLVLFQRHWETGAWHCRIL